MANIDTLIEQIFRKSKENFGVDRPMKKITISGSVFQTLLICSVRYALGRSTYVVEEIASLTLNYWPKIQECNQKTIIRDIKIALEEDKAGMTCEVRTWSRLLEDLENA